MITYHKLQMRFIVLRLPSMGLKTPKEASMDTVKTENGTQIRNCLWRYATFIEKTANMDVNIH